MARKSAVASHPERVALEMALAAGVSYDRVAARFGVHRDAAWRHWHKLSAEYKAALIYDVPREELVRRAAEESGTLLDHHKLVRNLVERQLIEAKLCSDSGAVARLATAAVAANDAVGRLTGEAERFGRGGAIFDAVPVTAMPEWRLLITGLLDIARQNPDVKDAIVNLIRRVKDAPTAASLPPMLEGAACAA